MKRNILLAVSIAALIATACGASYSAPDATRGSDILVGSGSDAEHFSTFDEAVRSADAVVLVSVMSSRPGRTVTVSNIDLPFTNVTMSVLDSAKGATPGTAIVVEQTGGPTPRGTLVSDDDPPYRSGSTHVLLLRKIAVGFRIVASLGRNEVVGGVVQPNSHATSANPFVGKKVTDFLAWAKQLH